MLYTYLSGSSINKIVQSKTYLLASVVCVFVMIFAITAVSPLPSIAKAEKQKYTDAEAVFLPLTLDSEDLSSTTTIPAQIIFIREKGSIVYRDNRDIDPAIVSMFQATFQALKNKRFDVYSKFLSSDEHNSTQQIKDSYQMLTSLASTFDGTPQIKDHILVGDCHLLTFYTKLGATINGQPLLPLYYFVFKSDEKSGISFSPSLAQSSTFQAIFDCVSHAMKKKIAINNMDKRKKVQVITPDPIGERYATASAHSA